MNTWKIWYVDGSTFTNDDGTPNDAPKHGVEVIAEKRDGRTILWVYGEVYCWIDNGWCCAPTRNRHWPDDAPTLYGKQTDDASFVRMKTEAMEWLHRA